MKYSCWMYADLDQYKLHLGCVVLRVCIGCSVISVPYTGLQGLIIAVSAEGVF